MPSEVDDIA